MSLTPDPNSANATGEINRLALKLPNFWEKQADLWLINIEAQFLLTNISNDVTK